MTHRRDDEYDRLVEAGERSRRAYIAAARSSRYEFRSQCAAFFRWCGRRRGIGKASPSWRADKRRRCLLKRKWGLRAHDACQVVRQEWTGARAVRPVLTQIKITISLSDGVRVRSRLQGPD